MNNQSWHADLEHSLVNHPESCSCAFQGLADAPNIMGKRSKGCVLSVIETTRFQWWERDSFIT